MREAARAAECVRRAKEIVEQQSRQIQQRGAVDDVARGSGEPAARRRPRVWSSDSDNDDDDEGELDDLSQLHEFRQLAGGPTVLTLSHIPGSSRMESAL